MISRTLHPYFLYAYKKGFLFLFWVCKRVKRVLYTLRVLGHEFLLWKNREGSSSLRVCAKIRFLRFWSSGFGKREKIRRKIIFLSIFLLSLHLLQKSIFNFWKDSKDLKKRSRSVKKKIFVQASTPKKTDQIGASSGFFVETGCMCGYEQPARILSAISFNSGDHQPVLRYQVLNSD